MATSPLSHVEAASMLAVIASSNEPLLFLGEDLRLIAASVRSAVLSESIL